VSAGQSVALDVDGERVELAADEIIVQARPRAGYAVAGDGDLTVALDTSLTPELVREGVARELVRTINDLRKRAGLEITDRSAGNLARLYRGGNPGPGVGRRAGRGLYG
jgi:isoleucyl-tRNA synthetase